MSSVASTKSTNFLSTKNTEEHEVLNQNRTRGVSRRLARAPHSCPSCPSWTILFAILVDAFDLPPPPRSHIPMPLASFLQNLPHDSIPAGLAILSLAVTIGLAIGAIRIRGVRLGVSGVLFSALAFGQIGLSVDANVLRFLRDFALILFMY